MLRVRFKYCSDFQIYFTIFSNPGDYYVRVGQHNLETDTDYQEFNGERIVKHEAYNSRGHYNDIALLKLSDSILNSQKVLPICLPTASMADPRYLDGKYATITGWGHLRYG